MIGESLEQTTATLVRRLLDARNANGHWEGKLASSALSTATAVIALSLTDRAKFDALIVAGIEWLATHVNPDSGWGDTVLSISNISTTALAWAAFAVAGSGQHAAVEAGAEAWLDRRAGSVDPQDLASAI